MVSTLSRCGSLHKIDTLVANLMEEGWLSAETAKGVPQLVRALMADRCFQSEEITEESPERAILKILDEFLAKIKSNDTRLTMKELEVTLKNFKDLKKILLEKIEEIERGILLDLVLYVSTLDLSLCLLEFTDPTPKEGTSILKAISSAMVLLKGLMLLNNLPQYLKWHFILINRINALLQVKLAQVRRDQNISTTTVLTGFGSGLLRDELYWRWTNSGNSCMFTVKSPLDLEGTNFWTSFAPKKVQISIGCWPAAHWCVPAGWRQC
ncbi:hypothetical protein ZIOFF_005780 [Zingiber officinale]|uniref:Uncharacterized protein n=1 Tax=Zingiber officinale TaxID=94328 RepID=A0A8J5LRW0_ZINOF|nr:hypothetical protein ZIOFF_005780 [Zingiber officinale]